MHRQALLYSLVETILLKYLTDVADPALYITNFIQMNFKLFQEDRLLQQWLALLDSVPPVTQ